MADRAELVEATLECLPEGVALLDADCRIVFWNQAASAITGFQAMDLVGRQAPDELKPLLAAACEWRGERVEALLNGRGYPASTRHKLGHTVLAMARALPLRDGMGTRIGNAVVFHPAECLEALPQGSASENLEVESTQSELKDRLESLFQDMTLGGPAFGALWITVDQAHDLRRSHGVGACEAMMTRVERTLMQGLRPAEFLGRWGDDEFLVISHERTPAMLAAHAQTLAGLARTADFRWWGDRVSITVSIGAAQAAPENSLAVLLEKAKAAMFSSYHSGGNQITAASEAQACSQS